MPKTVKKSEEALRGGDKIEDDGQSATHRLIRLTGYRVPGNGAWLRGRAGIRVEEGAKDPPWITYG